MKRKSIILVGTGAVIGFISCGVIVIKKILENERTRAALKCIISDKVEWFLYGDAPRNSTASKTSYRSFYEDRSNN